MEKMENIEPGNPALNIIEAIDPVLDGDGLPVLCCWFALRLIRLR